MFKGEVRSSRAELASDLLTRPGLIDATIQQADWLPAVDRPHISADPFLKGVAAYHDITRRARLPVARDVAFAVAHQAIEGANDSDPEWTKRVLESLPETIETTLASLAAMTQLGLATETVEYHLSAKVLLDAYLDLFEGCLPPLAKIFIPLRSTQDPRRKDPDDLAQDSARTLYEQLAKGLTWKALLSPFDPFYRNGIAHRSTTISPDGSVVVRDNEEGVERYLSWPHLVALVQDAISVISALLASTELSRLRPRRPATISSIEGREVLGFYLLPLGQVLHEWEPSESGLLTMSIRGRRCAEIDLLAQIVEALRWLSPSPNSLFIRYLSSNAQQRGYWGIGPELLAAAKESVEGIEAAVRESQSNQLRL